AVCVWVKFGSRKVCTSKATWAKPHYTNVRMPFPHRPPEVPALNPTGIHERTFRLPGEWLGEGGGVHLGAAARRVVLHVGAAESVLIVELDGVEIGVSKDSHLAAEFDLTDFVEPGVDQVLR